MHENQIQSIKYIVTMAVEKILKKHNNCIFYKQFMFEKNKNKKKSLIYINNFE